MRRWGLFLAFLAGSGACGSDATEVAPGGNSNSGGSGTETTTGTVTTTDSNSGSATDGTDSMSGTTAMTMSASESNSASMTGMTQGSESDGTDSNGTDSGTTMGVSAGSSGGDDTTGMMMVCMQQDMAAEPGNNDQQGMPGAPGDLDCDDAPVAFTGTLDGSMDDDWFGASAFWNASCGGEDDGRLLVNVGGGLSVCAYHRCNGQADEFNCVAGLTQDTSPAGDLGCCGTDSVTADWACNNSSNGALVYFVVNGATGNECVNYSGTYDFNGGDFIPG